MKPNLILGGGLTGLVAAERLRAGGQPALVLEKEAEPGGACRSIECDGFTFDYTGHLLHLAQPESAQYLGQLGVWDRLQEHTRRAAVMVGGRITPYPIQINTHGLAPEVRRDCLLGFIHAWASDDGKTSANFHEWVLDRFGAGLAEHFFFPYNRKLYRTPPSELSLDWVNRYVPRPGIEEVVDGAFGLHRAAVGYNATFHYPAQGGIRILPDAVAARVSDLELEAEVTAIHLGEQWVELASGQRIAYRRLVATLTLPLLLDLLADDLPAAITAARARLRWVRVFNLALGVAGEEPTDQHWLYFPDVDLPFYRVGFTSNHGVLAPPGCHTISVEVSLDPDSDTSGVASAAEQALVGVGLLDSAAVMVRMEKVVDPAYAVFDLERAGALGVLREYLEERGVILAGRWAEWKYSAMEDAILDGMAAARCLMPENVGPLTEAGC